VIRLAIRVQEAQAELVLAELLELAPSGVEEVAGEAGTPSAGTVEYAVYGTPGELPAIPLLRAAVGGALVEVTSSEVPDDWHERWREFHRPVLVQAPREQSGHAVPSLRIRPPWEPAEAGAGASRREIVIDPGLAFGTGGHATTRLCLELLLELAAADPARGPVLDVGTGSGVLAIAARMLGFQPVLALDNDPESVAAAQENARVNGVALEVRRFDLRRDPLSASGTLVLANLLRPLLIELEAHIDRPPAHLLAGGLLVDQASEVATAFARRLGLRERVRRERGEWAALWLTV
jgi:ribosomal protein L11 methyltransferase